MLTLGKGVAFFFIFIGISITNHTVIAQEMAPLNWLPQFSTRMAKLQPDRRCPQNQINGLVVNKSGDKIEATIAEVNWDINCSSPKTKATVVQDKNIQITQLLTQLVELPLFDLDIDEVHLATELLKNKFSFALSAGNSASQWIIKIDNELIEAQLTLDLQAKKLMLDARIELSQLATYIQLTELQKSALNNQLLLQYRSDLNVWHKGHLSASWQGVINDLSEQVALALTADVDLLKKQLTLSHFDVNAQQVVLPLSEKQSWKTAFIKLQISDPAIIDLSPLQIHALPMQLSIGNSQLISKVERGKSKRIRLDKQSLPALFLQLAVKGEMQDLQGDWQLALLNQALQGKLRIKAHDISLQLVDNRLELKALVASLASYLDSLQLLEVEQGVLAVNFMAKYDRIEQNLEFESELASQAVSGNNGEVLFDGVDVYSHLHYLVDVQKKITVIDDKQQIKVDNVFVGIPIQALQVEAKLDAGLPVVQHFKARLLGGQLDFDDFNLNAPSQTTVNINAISLAELIKYSAYPEIKGKGVIDAILPLTLTHEGPVIKEGRVVARSPGGYIKVPENTVIKAMGSGNPAVALTLQLLSDYHFDTLQGRIGYTSDGESDLKVEIKGISPAVSGTQPVNFNYSHNENILKLLKTLRFSDELVRDIKERY